MQVLAHGGLLRFQPPSIHALLHVAGLPLRAAELASSGSMSAQQAAVSLAYLPRLGLPHGQLRHVLLQVRQVLLIIGHAMQLQTHHGCALGVIQLQMYFMCTVLYTVCVL